MDTITDKIKNRLSTMKGLLNFLWKKKIYWLIPLMIILFIFAVVIIIGASTGLGPLIYPLI